jgi:SNF2 family DNA or RNA helicase
MPASTLTLPPSFINRISNAYQAEEPPQFYGGIIADPMGLGKTLTMIALIATDLTGYCYGDFTMNESVDDDLSNKTTLVIVPPPRTSLSNPIIIWLS